MYLTDGDHVYLARMIASMPRKRCGQGDRSRKGCANLAPRLAYGDPGVILGAMAKTILITGTTSGIGQEAALGLARRGHRVLATGRSQAKLDALKAMATGLPLETVRIDVTDEASIKAAVARVLELTQGRGIDALVNNAGTNISCTVEDVSMADLRSLFETNFFGLIAVTQAFLPQLRANRGRLVNVGSISGEIALPLWGPYGATKYALEGITQALRHELYPLGVHASVVAPGPIKTPIEERMSESLAVYENRETPYAPFYRGIRAMWDQGASAMASPEVVVRAIEHAITSARPRPRYRVPSWWFFPMFLAAIVPDRLLSWMSAKIMWKP
jgi:NAD(P)-dependent dehydrogenase (short-subunit alcohol dehydrogenase family)